MGKRYLVIIALLSFCMAGSSCTKQDTSKGEGPKTGTGQATHEPLPPQDRKAGAISKGIEETKKIVVARVNGEDITMDTLIREMNRVASRYIKPGQSTTPAEDEQIKHEALEMLIFHELAIQEAVKQGIKVRPDTVEAVVKELKSKLGSDEAFQRYLTLRGLSESELRKKIERNRRFELITASEIYQKIHVSEKMLREEYRKNKDQLKTQTEPSQPMSYEEAKPIIERKLKAEIGAEKMKEWDTKLRKKANVEILLAEAEKKIKPVPERKVEPGD